MRKFIFILIVFIALNNSYSILAAEASKTSFSINDLQWEYTPGDSPINENGVPIWTYGKTNSVYWQPCAMPQRGMNDVSDNYLWLKTTLPHNKIKEAALFLMTFDKACEVYLDGKLLHQFGDFKSINDRYSPGSLWRVIDMPEDYAGKTIFLRLYSHKKYKTGVLGSFELGPKISFPEKMIRQDIDTVLLAGLFVFVGLCSLAVSMVGKTKGNKQAFFFLGLFSIFIGVWLTSSLNIKQYFINSPLFWMYQSYLTLYLTPVWFCLFLRSIVNKKFAATLGKIAAGTFIYALACIIGSALQIFAIPSTSGQFHLLLSLIILVITYMTATSLFNGSKIERTFGISFVLLYVFIIIDIVRWYIVVTDNFKFYVQWAMLILIIIMAFSLIIQLIESQNKLKLYSEEIRLKEEVLEEKKKLLSEMSSYDKMKTEFFVNISHELRTPLNIILSTLQLINLYIHRGQLPFGKIELPRHMRVMKQNCYRLLRLVNNVIDISKFDSGFMQPFFCRQDIVSVVEDTTLSVVNYIQSNKIELCFDTDIEEKIMCFDKEKLERILLNLLSNAVKFSRSGSTINVELFDKKDAVCIVVKDTGIGIPKDTLQAIFERFVQTDKSLSRSQEGSGIGLSLVKSLVEIHKGTIAVESEYGKGSTFTVTLPATLQETIKQGSEELNLPNSSVEKVHIEFSDIYNV